MGFSIYIPSDTINVLLMYFLCIVFLCGFSVVLWGYNLNLKKEWLNNYKLVMDGYDHAFKSAMWKMGVYLLFAFPVTFLMVLGASTLVAIRPSWYISLLLLILFTKVAILFYLVVYPLALLCTRIAAMGALFINDYMKERYPLQFL